MAKPVVDAPGVDRAFSGVLITVVVLALIVIAGRDVAAGDQALRLDSTVYRNAINEMLAGRGLYDYSLNMFGRQFPFNYPPFAALVLLPFALLPIGWSQGLWMVLQIAVAAVAVGALLTRPFPGRLPVGWKRTATVILATMVFLTSSAAAQSLLLGQVSLLVGAAVVIDFLLVPPRYRGILTGLAGAVKLLPLIFLPYLLVTRQWRAAGNVVVGFLVATVLAFVALPTDSVRYWTIEILATGRVGEFGDLRNKSIRGLLAHWELGGGSVQVWWLLLAAVLAGFGFWRAWAHHRRGEEAAAILVVAVVAGLVSPISWPHHLMAFALVPLYLMLVGGRTWPIVGLALVVAFAYWSPLAIPVDAAPVWQEVSQYLMTLVMAAIAVWGLPSPRPLVTTPGPSDVG